MWENPTVLWSSHSILKYITQYYYVLIFPQPLHYYCHKHLFDWGVIQYCIHCEQAGWFIYMCYRNASTVLSWNALVTVRSVVSVQMLSGRKMSFQASGPESFCGQEHSVSRNILMLTSCLHWLAYFLWNGSFICVWEPHHFPGIDFTQNTSWAVSDWNKGERKS